MDITEVRIKLMEDSDDRLQAFCSITLDDCFVIRDLKIIEGTNGPFVAMPSRKLTSHCPQCGSKNHLRSAYCNQCGRRLKDDRTIRDQDGRTKLYADIAHPINSVCREMIQQRVIAEFETELNRAGEPGYVSHYDDTYEDLLDADELAGVIPQEETPQPRASERTHIQPADVEPRPPHRPHQQQSPQRHAESRNRKRGQFGAGIFE